MPSRLNIKTWEVYWRLTIIKESAPRVTPWGSVKRYFKCKCTCWNEKEYLIEHLRTWKTRSCWCYRIEFLKSQTWEKSSQWKWGSNIWHRIRSSNEYIKWRTNCFERDNYTCQVSGKKWGKLNVHHLNPLAMIIDDIEWDFRYNEQLWDLSNGITISEELHKDFHRKYGRVWFTIEDFNEFKCIVGSTGE